MSDDSAKRDSTMRSDTTMRDSSTTCSSGKHNSSKAQNSSKIATLLSINDEIVEAAPETVSKTTAQRAVCPICPHACRLKEGQLGICGARRAVNGKVIAESYGKLTALSLDPIEKKPFARFYPGSMVLSIGSYGCNLSCPFCQNSPIACARADTLTLQTEHYSPQELVDQASKLRDRGNIGIAYTYNEPLINYEYVQDTARLARAIGLKNVLVSNGYVQEQPLLELLPYLDAVNIDLKGFTQEFYDQVSAPQGLKTVKRTIELLATHAGLPRHSQSFDGTCFELHNKTCLLPATPHLEVTTLIIPHKNDSVQEIEQLAQWLAAIDPHIPLHLSRFHPAHHMQSIAPTPHTTIHVLAQTARQYLAHVYTGNM